MRAAYRAGDPESFNDDDVAAAAALCDTLAEYGGAELVGPGGALSQGTFWSGFRF